MERPRPTVPHRHGEVVMEPGFPEWGALMSRNQQDASSWTFDVAGEPVARFRQLARLQALDIASDYSRRLGIKFDTPESAPISMTGHQPDFYHPGVWIKNFALQRVARQTGSLAVNLVVDSDAFESIAVTTPCRTPELGRCTHRLATGTGQGWYACSAVPERAQVDGFTSAVDASLATLPANAVARTFARFSSALIEAASLAENVAELMTVARRRYEATTTYLELPVTGLATTSAFVAFAADIARSPRRFAASYNAELDEYRERAGTRDKTQPFPNLQMGEDAVELPFWVLMDGQRRTAWVRSAGGVEVLAAGEQVVAGLDESFVLEPDVILAPKALTLTLYARMFLCDLFIHGVGGGRYDRVTTGVARRFYGAVPPEFVVASATMHLPLGQKESREDELAETRERLRRLEFNPDEFVSQVEFDDAASREVAMALCAEKAELKRAVSAPDADKRAIGSRIGAVNAELGALLKGHENRLRAKIDELAAQTVELNILSDRSYPFCLWDPEEIAGLVS